MAALRAVVRFAFETGWRVPSEVLTLQWRGVDFAADELRLDAGTKKNGEARIFAITRDLRALLEAQQAERARVPQAGDVVAWVFFRLVAKDAAARRRPSRSRRSTRRGRPRAAPPDTPAGFRTTFGGARSGGWCGPASPKASR